MWLKELGASEQDIEAFFSRGACRFKANDVCQLQLYREAIGIRYGVEVTLCPLEDVAMREVLTQVLTPYDTVDASLRFYSSDLWYCMQITGVNQEGDIDGLNDMVEDVSELVKQMNMVQQGQSYSKKTPSLHC